MGLRSRALRTLVELRYKLLLHVIDNYSSNPNGGRDE